MVKDLLLKFIILGSILSCLNLASCSKEIPFDDNKNDTEIPEQPENSNASTVSIKFDLGSLSRANIPRDLKKYDVKVYVYQSEDSEGGFLVGNGIWNEEFSPYTLFNEYDYNGTSIDIDLKHYDDPFIGIVTKWKRYQYIIVTIASTKGSKTLPTISEGIGISGQFTNTISENTESIEVFKDYFEIKNSDKDKKPDDNDTLDFSELEAAGKYNPEKGTMKAILTRKNGEVQVTVMNNATTEETLLKTKTIDVTISGATSAIGFEPGISPVDSKTGLTYDVYLSEETATVKKTFAVDFNIHAAEVLELQSLPRYIYKEGVSAQGIELKLEFKAEDGSVLYTASVVPEKHFYIYPNTRSKITLGKSGFEFGGHIDLDDDEWDGIH